jgi:branched-chain amino acid transport system ATP-binding protein
VSVAPPALEVSGLCKSFGALRVLTDVDLAVAPGERRVLIGPNGAGKTTFFHLVSGLLGADGGHIRLGGTDVTRLPVHRRAACGLARTFQISTLFPHLTVRQGLLLALLGGRRTRYAMLRPLRAFPDLAAEADDLLANWGLEARRAAPVHQLSYGEQRQMEVLLAVAQGPRLLMLDEPTAGLSPTETQAMVRLIRGLPTTLSMLVIEHDMDVAFQIADTLSVLHGGRVVVTGDRETVRSDGRVQEIYLGAAAGRLHGR